MLLDVLTVDSQLKRRHILVTRVEGNVLQHLLEHSVQAARADVFRRLVRRKRRVRNRFDGAVLKRQHHLVHRQQRLVLQRQRVVRLRQNPLEVLARQTLQLHMHREAPLPHGTRPPQ